VKSKRLNLDAEEMIVLEGGEVIFLQAAGAYWLEGKICKMNKL
jgi:hypothetical protein